MRSLRSLLVGTLALGLLACASLPENLPRGATGYARAPQPGGPLAVVEAALHERIGPTRSGFVLLDSNEDGLKWRLALIDSAQHSIDVQYYVWWDDESGSLLMKRVIEAADRGVKVRLILDDLTTILEDETHPKLRDAAEALVDAHPNIEIRLFNAWRSRELAGRAVETLNRMERINHRMHNKLLVVDNRAAILGGRNIGNEYFGLSPEFNFRDLDVLGVGPTARQASGVFDRFWNSDWVVPVKALGIAATREDLRKEYAPVRRKLATAPSLARFPLDRQDWSAALAKLPGEMHAGTSLVHTDTPDGDALNHHMPRAIRELVGSAQREVLVTNAYIIPDEASVRLIQTHTARGVKFRILTNSLASHDVPAVNSHYKQWRKPLARSGRRPLRNAFRCRRAAAARRHAADEGEVHGAARQGDGDRPRARLHRLDESRPALDADQQRDGGDRGQPRPRRAARPRDGTRHGAGQRLAGDARRERSRFAGPPATRSSRRSRRAVSGSGSRT